MGKRKFSPSFWYDGGSAITVSCTLCHACKKFEVGLLNGKGYTKCQVKGEIPLAIKKKKIFQCSDFDPDKKSRDYDLVMKLIKESQEAKDGSQ